MEWIKKFLDKQKENDLLRALNTASHRQGGKIHINGKEYFDFSSNDYLGLSSHPKIIAAARHATEKYGNSASASRLLSGNLEINHVLEAKVAALKGKESALIFNSGYQANSGIFKSLFSKEDAIFSDRHNHASIIDGILLSGAQLFRFHHNDMGHLKMLLKKYRHKYRRALVVTETIFSMDGDRPPLSEIVELKNKFNCQLIVDEAHATGIFGKNGAGVAEDEGLTHEIDIIMGTFGKALGSFGAYVAASKTITDYLINTCRSFIYSTALPPAIIAANIASLELLKEEPHRRKKLCEKSRLFHKYLESISLKTKGNSQIIPLIVGESKKAVALSQQLEAAGFFVLPIRPPTVPQGQARLRFSLTFDHSEEIIEKLIKEVLQSCLI
ncbi:MAG: 8-amino-7-oxononanoate synthase [Candidatus Margulisbacteria bacterium]|nr:8-amino-7-oxononanoate synthase [Candidatus Margulisiibacteriota bacterium]MBU1021204.1 8-amino-7-oxononanoate synthase [Candidatus Margulisiibacteriota bacterium]MBU1729810.1 8-amino-7-oxononanoate synthase [Candidatus Margulisiibacteriota bacterium]MBU1955311.1 8-amino-7-oxononanoate synthase [Candidatus Margulisiibacteriota bacterium]